MWRDLSQSYLGRNTALLQQISSDCPVVTLWDEGMWRSTPVQQATWNLSVIAGVIRNNMTDCNLVSWGSFPPPPPLPPPPYMQYSIVYLIEIMVLMTIVCAKRGERTKKYFPLPSWKVLTSLVENMITCSLYETCLWLSHKQPCYSKTKQQRKLFDFYQFWL